MAEQVAFEMLEVNRALFYLLISLEKECSGQRKQHKGSDSRSAHTYLGHLD